MKKELEKYGENIKLLKFVHPKDETIFKSAEDEIRRYCSFKLKDRIFGKNVKISPSYISYLIKYVGEYKISLNEGEVTNENFSKYSSLLTTTLVGEEYKGGIGFHFTDSIPFYDDYKCMRNNFWYSTFNSFESSFERYLSLLGEIRKARRNFDILSREKKEIYLGKEVEEEIDKIKIDQILDCLKKIGKEMSECKEIVDNYSNITVTRVLRYFVNSEGSKMKGDDLYIEIEIGGVSYDNYGELDFSQHIYSRSSEIELEKIRKAGEKVKKVLLELTKCDREKAGIYPVIIDHSLHETIWHECIGHLLEVRDDEVESFSGKIGKKIAPSFLSVYSNPNLKFGYGSYEFDDEGVRGKKVTLIEEGILKGHLHSRLTAGKYGKKSNGHARMGIDKEDCCVETHPIPRMSNLIVLSKKKYSFEDLKKKAMEIAEKKGRNYILYCKGYLKGEVEIDSGKNEAHPQEIFRIYTNGKIERVKDIYIIGTPYLLINKIIACTETSKAQSGGYCVAESGSIPVGGYAPSGLLIDVEFARETKRNERRPLISKP